MEGWEFWEEHRDLLNSAWKQYPKRHPTLYNWDSFESLYIAPSLRRAVEGAHRDRTARAEAEVLSAFQAAGIPGVLQSQEVFTPLFLQQFQEELDWIAQSGIPQRRPNGMNRFGNIIDDVGFNSTITAFVDKYLRPIAQVAYPDVIGEGDADEHYSFTVRYRRGEDLNLTRHRDASVVTMNLCLGREWTGGELVFYDVLQVPQDRKLGGLPAESTEGQVPFHFRPGTVLLHKGQHEHEAMELISGERSNLIIWLHGKHGVVRVAEYKPHERTTPMERWQCKNPALCRAD